MKRRFEPLLETIAAAKFFGRTVNEWVTPIPQDGHCGILHRGDKVFVGDKFYGEIPWR